MPTSRVSDPQPKGETQRFLEGDEPPSREDPNELSRLLDPNGIKAKYKIELHFGKDRTTLGLNTCAVLIWESGRRFHGGGDDKMYWCGYKDCGKPVRSSTFGPYHLVCPKCQRECFLDPHSKAEHVAKAPHRSSKGMKMEDIPVISGEKLMKLPMKKIAEYLTKLWYDLEANADVYVKYHPSDIRFDLKSEGITKVVDGMDKARSSRSPSIYPLKNIIKDTSAGADLARRFLALITA
jgi:hypothetical protein